MGKHQSGDNCGQVQLVGMLWCVSESVSIRARSHKDGVVRHPAAPRQSALCEHDQLDDKPN
jgi:hypothetical protein